jgi:hypothetical protein
MELKTHFDKITGLMGRLKSNEATRASEAGEDRENIGSMLELTNLNKKAFSWNRMLDKMEPDKRDDVLRSFDALRALLEPHWEGQSTPDMLDGKPPIEEPKDEKAEVKPTADPKAKVKAAPKAKAAPKSKSAEEDEFDNEVDEAMGDERVVPINFGGGKK